jgi:hypothetical protein
MLAPPAKAGTSVTVTTAFEMFPGLPSAASWIVPVSANGPAVPPATLTWKDCGLLAAGVMAASSFKTVSVFVPKLPAAAAELKVADIVYVPAPLSIV